MAKITQELEQQARAAKIVKRIKEERRIKTVFIREDILLNWFANGLKQPTGGFITAVEGIPDNAIPMGVEWRQEYGAFCFLLGSLEFDSVPEGQYAPALNILVKQVSHE